MTLPLGKLLGVSAADYHAAECISHSKLETFRRRPALYRKQFIEKSVARVETDDMRIGRGFHAHLLEGPGAYDAGFIHIPDDAPDRPTRKMIDAVNRSPESQARISWWLKFNEAAKGKTMLTAKSAALIQPMTDAVRDHPIAWELLREGEPEVTWRAKANKLAMPLQCRTDWFNAKGCELTDGRPYVVDVKSVDSLDDAEFRNFERAFVNLGYHRQVGFYCPLLTDCSVTCWDFFFVVVEKQEPFGCAVYKPNEDAVARGMDETLQDLDHLAECYKRNLWPNMPTTIQEIGLPAWYTRAA